MQSFTVRTRSRTEMIDITPRVREAIRAEGLEEGLCVVFVPHTTAGVTINENADPDVQRDILTEINKVIPFADGYAHGEGNSAAHIKASLMGSAVQLIVESGLPALGTWQSVFFCEFDGPRSRRAFVACR